MSNNLTLSIPFSKVDQTRRVVTGYATAENIDPAGDLIEYSASQEAFSNWVGNIREMHAPKAVGKAISYRPVMVPYQGREYRGFEVDAYISKGAQDTWEKILDGTLKGFSVGGKIVKSSNIIDKSTSQNVRHIEEYELNELSLVDNMGNPAAAVTMVKMADDGSLNYNLSKYTIFYCDKHSVSRINDSNCVHGDTMRQIGSIDELNIEVIEKMMNIEVEKNISQIDSKNNLLKENTGGNMDLLKDIKDDTVDSVQSLSENAKIGLISKFITWVSGDTSDDISKSVNVSESVVESSVSSNTQTVPNINIYVNRDADVEKAGQESSIVKAEVCPNCEYKMADGEDTCPDCGHSLEKQTEVAAATEEVEVADDSMTKSDNSDEIITDGENDGGNEMDIEKLMEGIGSLLDEKISKLKEEVVSTVDEKFAEITKSVDDKFEGVEDRVEKVESAGAVKKSVDESLLDEETVIEKKAESFWGGIFVPAEIAEVLGYES